MTADRQWFVLYVLVCLEVGIFLIFVPWSAIWERNYFLENYPGLRPLILSPAMRGAVCGLGFGNVYLAAHEILARLRGRPKAAGPRPSGAARVEPSARARPESPQEREGVFAASDDS